MWTSDCSGEIQSSVIDMIKWRGAHLVVLPPLSVFQASTKDQGRLESESALINEKYMTFVNEIEFRRVFENSKIV